MRVASVATVIGAASIMACDADAPAGPAGPDDRPSFNSGVIASATGGGRAQLPVGFSALRVSFSAVTKADGSAAGQFTQKYESAGGTVDFSGTVTCASVDAANGRAWIGGVITRNRSTNPAVMGAIHQPGRDVWFRVVDYGEGDSPDDRTTVLGFEGAAGFNTSADYCAGQPWAAGDANTWALFDGNIQVRP